MGQHKLTVETFCPLVDKQTVRCFSCRCTHTHAALCWGLTCVSVEDLAAVGEQLEHLQLAAVGGHHDVAVVFTQKLHVQHLVIVTHKL